MADQVNIVVTATDNFSGVLGNFGNIMTGIKSALDLAGQGLREFGQLAMQGLDAVASYERLTLTLESLTAKELLATGQAKDMAEALRMSGSMAQELLNWMQQVAIKSPFTMEGVAQAFRMAEAYGFTAEESKRLVQALIDFAAGTGAGEDSMSRIALALGQIQAKGKLAGQEVLQLVNAGLPVTQILAEAFNKTTAEITKMQADGLIPAEAAIKAITEYLETNFAGAAERQALSWAGLMGTFKDISQIGLREYFGGVLEALQPLAIVLSNWLQGSGLDLLRQWGDALGALVEPLALIGQVFLMRMEAGANPLTALIETLQGVNSAEIKPLADALLSIIGAIQTFISTGQSEGWGAAISELLAGFDLAGKLQSLSDNLAAALGTVDWSPLTEIIATVLGDAFALALAGLDTVVNDVNWSPLGYALGNALSQVWEGAVQWMTDNIGQPWYQNISAALDIGDKLRSKAIDLGRSIMEGLLYYMGGQFLRDMVAQKVLDFINVWKQILGIASPSTVFMNIGAQIVEGLRNGINNAWAGLLAFIGSFVASLLVPFAPILNLLGIDISGLTAGAGTPGGTLPPLTGGGGTTLTGTTNITNNFYGPVTFSQWPGGDINGGSYDCPSPNPFITSTTPTYPQVTPI